MLSSAFFPAFPTEVDSLAARVSSRSLTIVLATQRSFHKYMFSNKSSQYITELLFIPASTNFQ
eukprot:3969495-Pyramimonas_sp.AAC.1